MEVSSFPNLSNFTIKCTEEFFGPKRDELYVVIPITLIYAIIFVTGTIGNISTCIVISRNKAMHTATNYYLFSLAISDLLLLLSGLPQEIYLIWSRYPYVFGSIFCFLRGMFAETSANATVLTITAFTVERYLAICHPFLSHTMSKLSRAVKFILAIWFIAICLAVPQAMQFKVVQHGENCEFCDFVEPIITHSFAVSTFMFFVTPMTIITVLYVLIGLRLKSSRMMKRGGTHTRVQSQSSRKVVKMLVAVVVSFFICWAPFHAQRLYWMYSSFSEHDKETRSFYRKINDIVTYISGVLYYVSATINPVLYNIMSVKFREAFKETFARCCGIGHLQHGKPTRSYSVLSRSNQRGPESTDSGREDPTVHTQTSLAHKSSTDSFVGTHPNSRRTKTSSSLKQDDIEEEGTRNPRKEDCSSPCEKILPSERYIALRIDIQHPTKFSKFLRYFECMHNGKSEESRRLSTFYATALREPYIMMELQNTDNVEHVNRLRSPCDISNSSLKDVETGAIEDELTAYMKEVRKREYQIS